MKNLVVTIFSLVLVTACASKKQAGPSAYPNKIMRVGPDASLRETFRVIFPECKIAFEVTSNRDKSVYQINVVDSCDANHAGRDQDYAALLNAVFKVYPKNGFESLSSSSFFRLKFWEAKMALASLQSEKWAKFQANRNKVGAANSVFVEIFNEADLGAEIRQAFAKESMNLELYRVEKVMESKASALPFAAQYPELKNSNRRVAYTAGVYTFRTPQL